MKLSEHLFQNSKGTWENYLQHPFVVQMAEGTLDESRFQTYLLQDYLYLKEYIKLLSIGIYKSDDWKLIRFFSENISALIDETFRVHVPFMKKLGIDDSIISKATPHKNSVDYSSFMLKEAMDGDVLTILTLLLNCSWGYAYIAKEMTQRHPSCLNHPLYGSWFQDYACKDYQDTNQALIHMVDELGKDLSHEKISHLCTLFVTCGEYELGFWSIA